MNGKRSYWKLLIAGAGVGVGLLVSNCTIKTATDDGTAGTGNTSSGGAGNASSGTCTAGTRINGCICLSDNHVSSQVCGSDGLYGACDCAVSSTGGTTSSGGTSSVAGTAGTTTTAAGSGGYTGGTGGANGEAGAPDIDPTDCGACLATLCPTQWQACEADPQCLSANTDGSGQYERIIACVDGQRADGLVKRDVVRGCGVTIGANPDADLISQWAPEGMAATTTNLLNCMADAPGAAPASWANDDANYPLDAQMVPQPAPWAAGTCAKLACTSQITN